MNDCPFEYRKSIRQYIEEMIGEYNAKLIYDEYHYDSTVLSASAEDYMKLGVDEKSAKILYLARNIDPVPLTDKIKCSSDAYRHLKYLETYAIEHFVVLALNRSNHVITKPITISVGGTSGTVVDMKVLFRKLLSVNKINGFICAHNHPSGNKVPSETDYELTKKIREGAKLLDLSLFDHIIVVENGYTSFADEGHM